MGGLFKRQIIEQLANAGVLGEYGGAFVEAARLNFHSAHLAADLFQTQRGVQPDGLALHKAANVLPADERNVLPEFLPIKIDQSAAMADLFLARLDRKSVV